jgi:hypothetical protein
MAIRQNLELIEGDSKSYNLSFKDSSCLGFESLLLL